MNLKFNFIQPSKNLKRARDDELEEKRDEIFGEGGQPIANPVKTFALPFQRSTNF